MISLPSARVLRLTAPVEDGELHKGDQVLAVFPETTSFYRAVISKAPRRCAGGAIECIVKFEDDEDESGRTPHRRVHSRFVLPMPSAEPPEAYDDGGGGVPGGATYSDMIAHALGKLTQRVGSFKEICAIVENDFADQLNWKLESDLRKTPVWKSSVRKILYSNARFRHNLPAADKNIFTFSAYA